MKLACIQKKLEWYFSRGRANYVKSRSNSNVPWELKRSRYTSHKQWQQHLLSGMCIIFFSLPCEVIPFLFFNKYSGWCILYLWRNERALESLCWTFSWDIKPGLHIQLCELRFFVRIHSREGDSGGSEYYGSSGKSLS